MITSREEMSAASRTGSGTYRRRSVSETLLGCWTAETQTTRTAFDMGASLDRRHARLGHTKRDVRCIPPRR